MTLKDIAIKAFKPKEKPYRVFDGGGLYLEISPSGGILWRLKYRFGGREKRLAFGAYPIVSLREARERREQAKKLLSQGIDPGEVKKEAKAVAIAEQKEKENSFETVALDWYASYSPALTPKHSAKLLRYLETILFPAFGGKSVTALEPSVFVNAIRPTEAKGHITTAHKLMQLCSQVMEFAHLTGKVRYNPATGLSRALQPLRHQNLAAVTDPAAIGQLLRDIDAYEGFPSITAFLKILPYVFTRPSELRLAEWQEFKIDDAMWRIPASRMKMRREHTVPLSRQVLCLLDELREFSGPDRYLFPSAKTKSATISDAGPLAALRRMGYQKHEMTPHGFRAMASTRLNELGFRADVIEAQLAHREPDAVRLAYNRAEYTDERRKLMQAWADYLDGLRASKG